MFSLVAGCRCWVLGWPYRRHSDTHSVADAVYVGSATDTVGRSPFRGTWPAVVATMGSLAAAAAAAGGEAEAAAPPSSAAAAGAGTSGKDDACAACGAAAAALGRADDGRADVGRLLLLRLGAAVAGAAAAGPEQDAAGSSAPACLQEHTTRTNSASALARPGLDVFGTSQGAFPAPLSRLQILAPGLTHHSWSPPCAASPVSGSSHRRALLALLLVARLQPR